MKIADKITDDFFRDTNDVTETVKSIINDVRKNGDSAVKDYTKKFDNTEIENFEVSKEEIENAITSLDKEILEALKFSIKNVEDFAKAQLGSVKNVCFQADGAVLGHKIIPIEKVGCYIPGGNYPLPSTAVMTIVPAKVAGVKEIIAVSPKTKPVTIAAAHLAGATKIYKIGGVQAIAALAYGTETIPAVDKIVGPGNKYVATAKKIVYGDCGTDFVAGPSEVMVIADESANPEFVAADLLAQCEHDRDARAYLLCFDENFAKQVDESAKNFLKTLKTAEIAKFAYEKSVAYIVGNIDEAVEIANKKAPEHLELCLKNVNNEVDKFRNYGSLFIGNYSAEVFGDYVSGTNHTLPTSRAARYTGGLSVFDYIKIQTFQKIEDAELFAKYASILAEQEGLFAHKLASDVRKKH
ncbi:MAG: histidinol dehydrogenase [Candidatus Gastranaerophilales bacterium]|nr:histidinol dehydrogenase [Candidatus Gastranaerophilales bacterium]